MLVRPILLHQVETENGFNVIVDNCWCASFPKESEEQVKFLVANTNLAFQRKLGFSGDGPLNPDGAGVPKGPAGDAGQVGWMGDGGEMGGGRGT